MTSLAPLLKDVLFPVQCAGCGRWDAELCARCAELASQDVQSTWLDDSVGAPSVELLSLGPYEGELRSVILTAKHDASVDLTAFLRCSGATLGVAVAQRIKDALGPSVLGSRQTEHRSGRGRPQGPSGRPFPCIWVVPAPSSHARRRQRAEIVPDIAAGLVGALNRRGARAVRVEAVALRRGFRGQGGRSARDRWQGRSGAMVPRRLPSRHTPVVIVDDVVATGATMRALVECFPNQVIIVAALSVA